MKKLAQLPSSIELGFEMRLVASLLLLIFCFSVESYAQLPDGSIAPDFTMTDLKGDKHHLYKDYLDEGYTVILDFSAVWCPPCWGYHQSHALDEIYDLYGPETGDSTIMVFHIEADGGSIDEIKGLGGNTIGNWTSGVSYPILPTVGPNSIDVAADYDISYFPTIYTICPGGVITETGPLTIEEHLIFSSLNCSKRKGENNASVAFYTGDKDICGELTPAFMLANLGANPLTSCEASLKVDGEIVEKIDWIGNLSSLEYEEVSFSTLTDYTRNVALDIEVTNPNAEMDDDSSNNAYHLDVREVPLLSSTSIQIELQTDNYGDENYLAVVDYAGEIIAEFGNLNVGLENAGIAETPDSHPDSFDNNTVYNFDVELPSLDCFRVILTDIYGDGMSGYVSTNSYLKIIDPITENILYNIDGGAFSASLEKEVDGTGFPRAQFTYDRYGLDLSVTNNSINATDWLWEFGDGNESTSENPTHTYLQGVSFVLCLPASNEVGMDKECKMIMIVPIEEPSSTSIEENSEINPIHIYPNPTSNDLYLAFEVMELTSIKVEVNNLMGQELLSQQINLQPNQTQVLLPTDHLLTGTYLVNIHIGNEIWMKKVVVLR